MSANYGMQPAQPYGANANYGMTPVQDASNGYNSAPPQQNQYAAPPQQQYGMQQPNQYAPQQQQPNPYPAPDAAPEPTTAAGEKDDESPDKEIYNEEWVFTPAWDEAHEIKAKTACCCCSCAFDDCKNVMQIQNESVILCMASAISWKLFQCQDPSQRACCLNTQKVAFCDFTSEDEDVMCSLAFCGVNGIFCLCCSGQAYESMCDPCKMPETCCKTMCQMFCIHQRCALPCDDDVPFEISCCGYYIMEPENKV